MSLQQGAVKYSAGYLAQGRIDEVNKVVSSCFIYSIILAIIASTGSVIASAFYKDPSGKSGSALIVVGLLVLFLIPLTPYIAVIQSRQRYYIGAITQTISSYLTLLVVILWFRLVSPSTEALIVIMSVMLFLSRFVQVPVAYRLVPGLRNNPRFFDWESFKQLFTFGGAMVLVSLCLSANSTGVRWLMGTLVSTAFVAHLAIMLMPGSLLSQIVRAMTLTIMPATSAYEATGKQKMLQELLIRSMRYTVIVVSSAVIAAGFLMRNVLLVWVGPKFVFLAPYAMALFAGISFQAGASSAHHMLKGLGKLRTVIIIYFTGLVFVPLVVILALLKILNDPYVAVTGGLTLGSIVVGCLNFIFGIKTVNARFWSAFFRIFAQPFAVALPALMIGLGLIALGGINGLSDALVLRDSPFSYFLRVVT